MLEAAVHTRTDERPNGRTSERESVPSPAQPHLIIAPATPDLLETAEAPTRGPVTLMSREGFGALSLRDKNIYLNNVARLMARTRGQPDPQPLDKDSLARLRRFYMRRKASELALQTVGDEGLRATLRSFSETIHLGEVRKIIAHEARPVVTYREPPPDDAQLMFFVPPVHDAPLKDDMNLMDVAPFSLSKTIRQGIIRYELKDAIITIEGGAEVGLVTCYDYDIFINMVTSLAIAMRDYRIAEKRGLRPTLPPRVYRPKAADILRFCRRERGGKQYAQLESALDRLQATRYKITNLTQNNTRRASESFPLIGRFKVVSRTRQNFIDEVEIEIPEWVYEGVVTHDEAPSILTLHPDYFLISRPLARFIYRLARKACGTSGVAEYGLRTLYDRSGSQMPFGKFCKMIAEVVEATSTTPLPDYDIAITKGKNGDKLRMLDRSRKPPVVEEAA